MGRPRKRQIYVGLRHGHLTVQRELGPNSRRQTIYECVCDCGLSAKLRTSHFTDDRKYCSHKCSLLRRHMLKTDLADQKFGGWTVAGLAGSRNGALWHCVCICGKEQRIATYALLGKHTTNCGCLAAQARSKNRTPEEELKTRRLISRISARKHASRVKAAKIKYESKLKKASPHWLKKADWDAMDAIYERARELTQVTGVRHDVDHILPLNGKMISGLHIPSNLQILTQSQNVSKSNRYAEHSGD